jgi:hypothetical protein
MRALFLVCLFACGEHAAPKETTSPPPPPPANGSGAKGSDVTVVVPADAAVVPIDAAPVVEKKPGYDFIADIRALYRVVGCGHLDEPLPDALTHGDADRAAKLAKVIDHHCKELKPQMDKYRDEYFGKAREWFVAHEPADLPKTVVYGFGGGDLVSALVAFPNATAITTISLELSGDPRKYASLTPEQLDSALAAFRHDIGLLIGVGSNLSTNLSAQQRSQIAAQLSSHLLGMATGGYEPVAARFFAIDDNGAIHYFEKDEIDADQKSGKSLSGSWKSPAFAQSFYNVEVEYTAPNDPTIRVFRHIGWNLGDEYLKQHTGLLAHLASLGQVAICVKGGSYLLWHDDFSMFRQYMIDHGQWMVTDSTGLAPAYVDSAVFQQDAYGQFDGPPTGWKFETLDGTKASRSFRKLWASPKDKMPFRFGYLDKNGHNHIVITTRKK